MHTASLKHTAGFTLIELLVVISIIAMLASVVLASLNNARIKARDTQRIGSLNQLKVALNLYYDTNKAYPLVATWVTSTTNTCNWIPGLSPYIGCVTDPINTTCAASPATTANNGPWIGGTNYCYAYGFPQGPFPQNYDLVALLEETTNPQRCQIKLWPYYTENRNTSWCMAIVAAPPRPAFSIYMYADH